MFLLILNSQLRDELKMAAKADEITSVRLLLMFF